MSAYTLAARAAARRTVVAPSDLIVRGGFYLIIIAILSALWGAAADANGGNIAGYTSVALTWYMVFSEGAVNAIRPRLIEDIGIDIDSGGVAIEMLRPVSVAFFRIATEMGEALSRFMIMIVAGSAVGLALAGSPPDSSTFLLALPSGLLAVACSVAAQHLFAATSFWQGEAKGAWFLYLKLVFILGGMLLPLEVLPGWLETTAKILPFWTMAYAPARLAAGFNEPLLLVGQAAWLLVLTALALAAFRVGEKRVQTGVGMIFATLKRAFLEAWSRRSSFWFQISIMVLNDAVFVVFWFLFFNEVGEVRGWDADDALLLLSILATAAGIVLGLFANARRIGEMIAGGRLDAVLALPVNPLGYLLVRRVDAAMLGDVVFGPCLFLALGGVTPERAALYVVGSIAGAVVFLSFLVILGSLTFFLGGRGEHADFGFQAVLILASYPLEIFGGPTRLLLFTVVPAAFVTGLPTRLVDEFVWSTIGTLLGVAVAISLGAYTLFSAGLRRYRSGSVWTQA